MALGGAVVALAWLAVGSGDAHGLSLPMLHAAFSGAGPAVVDGLAPLTGPLLAALLAVALKLALTAVTVGSGFPGGDVTPLLVMGAVAGAALAGVLGVPPALGAGVGFAALYGAAAGVPLALVAMAAETLGAGVLPHAAIGTAAAWLLMGGRSLHASPVSVGPAGPRSIGAAGSGRPSGSAPGSSGKTKAAP